MTERAIPAVGSADAGFDVVLMAILVMQDVYLGVLMAILPNMAGHAVTAPGQRLSTVYFLLTIRLVVSKSSLYQCWA